MYLVSSSVKWSVISAVVTYLLHFPLPLNVDNFFAMYLTMKGLSVGELLGQIKLGLGFVSELDMRRAGVDNIRPKVVRGVSVQVKKMENYDLHIFTPDIIKSKGAVVFYHGGGFVVLHVYSYQKYLSSMAKELGCIVFSPEYRLAPEHPWPIGDGDCHHATEHVFSHAEMYNVDRHRIAMTGDSAGGFLTFVTWYRMREYFKKHNVQPALLSLVYPALGYRFDSPSYQRNGSMPFLSVDDVLFYYLAHGGWMEKGVPSPVKHNILKHSIHVDESKVSPSFLRNLDPERWLDEDELRDWVKPKTVTKVFTPEEAKFRLDVTKVIQDVTFVPLNVSDDELADFPSVVTYVCEHDVLKNDGQMLHNRLKHIGKESKLVVMEGAFHAQMIFAQQFLGLKAFKRTTKAFDEYVATIGTYIQ